MNVEIIKGAKAIKLAIVGVHEKGQSLQHDMHQVACSVLVHVAHTRDIQVAKTMFLSFIQAMPEMARTNALRDWFNAFSTMHIGEQDYVTLPDGKKANLSAAMDKPFWKFAPEKDYVPVDFAAEIKRLVNKLTTDAKKPGGADYTAEINALTTLASKRIVPHAPMAVSINSANVLPELADIPA